MELNFTKSLLKLQALLCTIFIFIGTASAQLAPVTIRGTVTDASGITLPGVKVSVKGTKMATATGGDGNYTLSPSRPLTAADVIEFHYIGFVTAAVSYQGNNVIHVQLKEDTK
ncbi:MAG TPA: carboxypeptidase-like regulatory domain-containing protein, partial [Daejeonella sp.]|nr:carboxypeptidase-like regulatory domain-containing protein [Daejeonella sp.]